MIITRSITERVVAPIRVWMHGLVIKESDTTRFRFLVLTFVRCSLVLIILTRIITVVVFNAIQEHCLLHWLDWITCSHTFC
jgi:hypothetical protein